MPNGQKERETVRLIGFFYLGMAAVGLALIGWRQSAFDIDPLALPGADWGLALLVTAGLTLAVHLLSRLARAGIRSFREGTRDIQRLLGNLTPLQVAAVALTSGIGEELLFRGWLLHETNLWISSLVFGLIHIPPNRNWLYWPFFAVAMGFLLGWLYSWTGSLLYPILLHAGVNFLNIRMLLPPSVVRRA